MVKDSVVPIRVTDHARERARERFPGFKAARIVDEVREAMRAGRISASPPTGWDRLPHYAALYAWTAGGERGFALHHANPRGFEHDELVVTTVVRLDGV